MSEVNKPEMNTAVKCPFNPEQYKSNEIPFHGSFPWAMIQVYLGGRIHRSSWKTADDNVRLVSVPGFGPNLERYDKKNGASIWTPTQDDMVECDWVRLKEDNKPDISCPFNLGQYTLAVIMGSLPWALIQVFLGNKVHRKDWDVSDGYLYLSQKSEKPGGGEEIAQIEKMFKYGQSQSWTPTQGDLMACDWVLWKAGDR
ncbi:DUF2829 domain-containing protein [Xenorhabdus sp. Reich]|uniref:DUF2829 domain-containing protein n=1 Tax=Xenorhabdus littoralis TaxID=2582835 RepID=A0ABU4SN48_9GAMM|nr:MW1434 family type I TA system toxin [Xenorhabdus sp. Reich]MDX8000040.1 DUF2829 domain-containing protein [Xenorhabdus sp. Reich]